MECDRGTRGQPASDGSLQGFFGGVRRCTERATNIYAGQGGESSSGELERLRKRAARLGRLRTSFKRQWRSSCEYADTQVEQARKQERRVESMLTSNLRYVLIQSLSRLCSLFLKISYSLSSELDASDRAASAFR